MKQQEGKPNKRIMSFQTPGKWAQCCPVGSVGSVGFPRRTRLSIFNPPPAHYKGPNAFGPCSCAKKAGSFAEQETHQTKYAIHHTPCTMHHIPHTTHCMLRTAVAEICTDYVVPPRLVVLIMNVIIAIAITITITSIIMYFSFLLLLLDVCEM